MSPSWLHTRTTSITAPGTVAAGRARRRGHSETGLPVIPRGHITRVAILWSSSAKKCSLLPTKCEWPPQKWSHPASFRSLFWRKSVCSLLQFGRREKKPKFFDVIASYNFGPKRSRFDLRITHSRFDLTGVPWCKLIQQARMCCVFLKMQLSANFSLILSRTFVNCQISQPRWLRACALCSKGVQTNLWVRPLNKIGLLIRTKLGVYSTVLTVIKSRAIQSRHARKNTS